MVGKLANEPATMSYRLKENQFFVGCRKNAYLYMVLIQVTGERTFDWIASRKIHLTYDSKCDSKEDFTSECFEGEEESKDDYDLKLVAKKGKLI